jgi:tetratricopeptide (TPR) repeat protein
MIMLSLLIVLGGCATKRYTKKGLKLEAMGQYSEAADMFYQAVVIKNTNLEAMAGLKRCGQMTLSKKLSEFNQAYNNEKNKEAVYFYQEAKAYYDKMMAVGCELNFPSFYEEYYNEAKILISKINIMRHLNFLMRKDLLSRKPYFANRENQPNYKDVKDKLIVAVNEPKYREGLRLMDAGVYRKAY